MTGDDEHHGRLNDLVEWPSHCPSCGHPVDDELEAETDLPACRVCGSEIPPIGNEDEIPLVGDENE